MSNDTRSVTLYAQWTVNQYPLHLRPGTGIARICYKINGATDWSSVTTNSDLGVNYDSTWYAYAEAEGGYEYTETSKDHPKSAKMTTEEAWFEPVAEPLNYSVNYNGNGSTSGSMSPTTFTRDKADYLRPNDYTREHSITYDTNYNGIHAIVNVKFPFQIWNDKADGAGEYSYKDQALATNVCDSHGDPVLLYAQWQKKSVSLPSLERNGYTFGGWYYDCACTTLAGASSDDFTPTNSLILYAKWNPHSYTVTFTGGKGAKGTMDPQAFTYGEPQALSPNLFVLDGYSFQRWKDANGNTYTNCETVCNLTDQDGGVVELCAVWAEGHYVAFDGNGATNETAMAMQTFYDDEYKALSSNVYGKVGYTFSGWATNAVLATNLVVAYANCQEVSFPDAQPGETNVLYAVWATNRYSVAFHPSAAGVTGEMPTMTNCFYDTTLYITNQYLNYASQGILGWSLTAGGTVDYATDANGVLAVSNLTSVADGCVDLYAVWDGVGALSEAVGLTNGVLRLDGTPLPRGNMWRVYTNESSEIEGDVCYFKNKNYAASGTEHVLSLSVCGPGQITFRWKASTGIYATGSKCLFAVGKRQTVLDSCETWVSVSTNITVRGTVALKWSVELNGYFNGFSVYPAALYLDDVRWEPFVGAPELSGEEVEDWVYNDLGARYKKEGESKLKYCQRFEEKFGSDYEAAYYKETGKVGTDGTPLRVYHDYIAGTDPLDESSKFTVSVKMVDGSPVVTYVPELSDAEKAKRTYRTLGKSALGDKTWTQVPAGDESKYNFFRATVQMP